MSVYSTDWPTQDGILQAWVSRGAITADQARGMADWLRPRSFWLAGNSNTQFVGEIQASLEKAQRSGLTFANWLPEAQKILDSHGGTARVYKGGERWPPWYADLVFRNATQAGLAGGRYAHMFSEEGIREAPFVIYRALHDLRTRPTHAALDGKVFRKTDTAARRYFPPSDHNCRCFLGEIDLDQLQEGGYQLMDGAQISSLPIKGGGTVGTPPRGWDRDQVEALVPGALRERPMAQAIPPDIMGEPGRNTRPGGMMLNETPAHRGGLLPPGGELPSPPVANPIQPVPFRFDPDLKRAAKELRKIKDHEEAVVFGSNGLTSSRYVGSRVEPLGIRIPDSERSALANTHMLHNHPGGGPLTLVRFDRSSGSYENDLAVSISMNLAGMMATGRRWGQPVISRIERPYMGWNSVPSCALAVAAAKADVYASPWAIAYRSWIGRLPSSRQERAWPEYDTLFSWHVAELVFERLGIPYDIIIAP